MEKVAVVTGAGSGIGSAITKKLIGDGYVVLGIDRDAKNLHMIQEELNSPKLHTEVCDVTNKKDVQAVISSYGEKMQHIDVLFNGVGQMKLGAFSDLKEEDWDISYKSNIKTVLYCIKSSLRYLKKSNNPNIINLSSILSETYEHNAIAYTVTKAMLIPFTKALAKDLSKDGIRVNCILPGPIQTQLMNNLVREAKQKQGGKELLMRLSNTPMNRMGKKEEVADTVSFIVSTQFITGSLLSLDGGWSL
ncbi:hypothetical protein CAI16_16465 [Virgibacillus dokdonensis]|uniref:3-oxoacyl-[acyl-carrier-protein] reductase FabG n=1 Tax=Virgibacillus dokdonensis TaxID=302167 RepID=A0A3E0WLJ5_9BACI|nr:SDR family oxidoreductase [Virgibacillus dokdonensis]RFA32957.1 hypothetical protein CAI16_16465 [Virgibacillus dokdonensis]